MGGYTQCVCCDYFVLLLDLVTCNGSHNHMRILPGIQNASYICTCVYCACVGMHTRILYMYTVYSLYAWHICMYPAAVYASCSLLGEWIVDCWYFLCIIYAQVGKSLGGPSQWSNQGVLALFRDLIIHVNV